MFDVPLNEQGGHNMAEASEWKVAHEAWAEFCTRHPELGFRQGHWPFHNFLRFHRPALIAADAIRLARKRFWIAHRERFSTVAFECATGGAGSRMPLSANTPMPHSKAHAVRPTGGEEWVVTS
jgi:hypothetical protein